MSSPLATPQHRPVTSRSRGLCRYYTTPRGCFAGDKCKFLHGVPEDPPVVDQPLLTPYDNAKRCRYFDQGFCKRGENCWFLHKTDGKDGRVDAPAEDDEEFCSICFEKPPTYGLLSGCGHIFCIKCIKQWRDPQNKAGGVLESGNTKKCPMCRASSAFITPSSKFWREGSEEKFQVTQAYKESMAKVPCKYFQKSIQKSKTNPICPYGMDCFYQHVKEDGMAFTFKDGVDVCMPRYRSMTRRREPLEPLDFSAVMPLALHLDGPLDFLRPRHSFGSNHVNADHGNGNASGSRSENRRPERNTDVVYAARRLREVGRSLEMLNDAISEGATLENLNFAVEALRVGLGRLEGNVDGIENPPRLRGRRGVDDSAAAADGWGENEEQVDEVRERLEILAGQMLSSINALRTGEADLSSPGSRAGTPPPPLISETMLDSARRALGEDSESDAAMPSLETMTDSSSERSDESEDEGDVEVHSTDYGDEIALELVRGLIGSWATEPGRSDSVRQDNSTSTPPPSARFSTVFEREESLPRAPADDEGDDLPPPLEFIDPPEETGVSSGESRKAVGSRPSDAFTTDGRGRVISVGGGDNPSENNELDPTSTAASTTTTSDNPVEDNPGGGGLFSWITSMF